MSVGAINILGEEIPFEVQFMPIDELKYFPENPRVYSLISLEDRQLAREQLQDVIEQELQTKSHVKKLVKTIEKHGGLAIPILVNFTNKEVIEGNSRLAAYRLLQKTDAHKWHLIRCQVVQSLTDKQIDSYLDLEHSEGKTPWEPYELASIFYRRIIDDGISYEEMLERFSLKRAEMRNFVETIQMMHKNSDGKKSNFSYYHEGIVEKRIVKSEIASNPKFKQYLLEEIKRGASFSAQDLRNKMPTVIEKKKMLQKLIKGEISLDMAYELSQRSPLEKTLKSVNSRLSNAPLDSDMQKQERNKCAPIVRKIKRALQRVDDFLAKEP